jgi:segregation and condensation protein B
MSKNPEVAIHTIEEQIAFVEAILFVSKEPVAPQRLIDFLDLKQVGEFEQILNKMRERYDNGHSGITLNLAGGGLQLVTKPDVHDSLKSFLTIKASSRLTIPSLETLSIIAYRQPVTIAEISDLRGVNSIGPVRSLLEKKLIKISGRKKVPGLPLLYSTTHDFLLYFGLNNLEELPSLEELTEMFEEKEQPGLFTDPI